MLPFFLSTTEESCHWIFLKSCSATINNIIVRLKQVPIPDKLLFQYSIFSTEEENGCKFAFFSVNTSYVVGPHPNS